MQTPVATADMVLSDGRVAAECASCGAGAAYAPHVSDTTCHVCRGVTCYRSCLRCKSVVVMYPDITGAGVTAWKCLSCGKQAARHRWPAASLGALGGQGDPFFKTAYARLGLTIAEASSDPERRRIDGAILQASGMSGIATGGCTVFFCRTGAALMIGHISNVTVIPYAQMRVLRFAGRGAVVTSSGGGWVGGGFGLEGALEGALMAGVLNALTTRTQMHVETLISFGWTGGQLVLMNNTFMPEAMARFLAPVVARIESSTPQRTTKGNGPDVVGRLQQLADLHASGALTAEEFAAAKSQIL